MAEEITSPEGAQRRADESAAAAAAAGTLAIGGRTFVVSAPTPEDELLIRRELRRQCLAELRTPLQRVADDIKGLPLALAEIAVRAAVEIQAGSTTGKGEPTEDALLDQLYTPSGAAFRVWALGRHAEPGLKLADVAPLISTDNVLEVIADLFGAMGEIEKKARASANAGPTTSPASGA